MQEVRVDLKSSIDRKKYLTRFWHVPSRNSNFTGRENLLNEIGSRLSQPKPVVITACHGLGGVGKTQLVTEYAYRNHDKYERILWIPAETADQIETAYLLLGQDLKILPEKTPPDVAINMVKAWLASHPRNLVIFDNAPDYQTVEPYLLSEGADVLITSRHTEWLEKGIEIDVFSLDEAVEYFRKIVGKRDIDTRQLIESLATELGKLPLALAQAAAYIRESKMSIEEYLDLYKEKKAILLSQELLPAGDNHAVVYVTWDITLEKIKEKSVLAPALLNICSYLHSENIPTFLLAPFCENKIFNPRGEEFFEEARGCLRNYSMVNVDEEGGYVSVHRLVQEVTQLKLDTKEKENYLTVVLQVCDEVFPYGSQRNQVKDIQTKKILMPHLEQLLPKTTGKERLLKLLVILQDAYGFSGLIAKQIEPLKAILAIRQSVDSPQDIQIGITLLNLGNAYFQLGKMHESLEVLKRAQKIIEAHPEEGVLEVARVSVSLGNVYGMLGNFELQCQLIEKGLKIYEDLPNQVLLELANILNNLSAAYGFKEDRTKEMELFFRAFSIKSKCYDEANHPEMARMKVTLGRMYRMKGELGKSRQLLEEEAIPVLKAYYGHDHVDVGKALLNLGKTYGELKQPLKELALLQEAYTIVKKHYGLNHPLVADLLLDLARVFFALKKVENAFRLSGTAHQIFLHHPEAGVSHPRTRAAAQAYLIISSEIVSQLENKLAQTPTDIQARLRVAELCLEHEDLNRSIFHYEIVAPSLEGQAAARAYHNLACLYDVKGQKEKAEEYFRTALVYFPQPSVYSEYGLFLYKQERYEEAVANLQQCFQIPGDKSELSYKLLEITRVEKSMQKEIREKGVLTLSSRILAYYLIIRCYRELDQEAEREKYLEEFRQLVEISAQPLYWRLLSYTYNYLDKTEEAEMCREMTAAIEISKSTETTAAVAIGQFGLLPTVLNSPRKGNEMTISEKLEQEKQTCKK